MDRHKTEENLFRQLVDSVEDYAIFALDTGGTVVSWNTGAQRINGYRPDEIIGKHFSVFYPENLKAVDHPGFELKEALKNGSYEEEGWRIRKDGTTFWANVLITAIRDDRGNHIGFTKVTRDLTEQNRAREEKALATTALQESERVFSSMVQAVKDYAIFKLDLNGTVRTWNRGAEKIKGYQASEIIGKDFSIFYTDDARKVNHPRFELDEAVKNGSYEEEGWRVRKDGSVFWASVTITHIGDGFLKVTRDLTERKRHETQLEEARDQAMSANQMKSQFVANVTHEIRTPLTSIVGLSELLVEESSDNEELSSSARTIFESSRLLLGLLNDLLDFAKLEAGRMVIDNVPFSISRLVEDVVGLSKIKADQKQLNLNTALSADLPNLVQGDPAKVRQILLNLVHNAIKFTDKGGIDVAVSLKDKHLYFAVTDTGIGIIKEKQDKLFHPFSQAHDATSKDYGGTGLGLSIAQQYAKLLHGEIGVISESGKGSTFWFAIPQEIKASEAADA